MAAHLEQITNQHMEIIVVFILTLLLAVGSWYHYCQSFAVAVVSSIHSPQTLQPEELPKSISDLYARLCMQVLTAGSCPFLALIMARWAPIKAIIREHTSLKIAVRCALLVWAEVRFCYDKNIRSKCYHPRIHSRPEVLHAQDGTSEPEIWQSFLSRCHLWDRWTICWLCLNIFRGRKLDTLKTWNINVPQLLSAPQTKGSLRAILPVPHHTSFWIACHPSEIVVR